MDTSLPVELLHKIIAMLPVVITWVPLFASCATGGHPPSHAATLKAIAAELKSREMVTPRGGRWHPSSVANLLRRIDVAAG